MSEPLAAPAPLEAQVWSALAEITDPEMPVNLVDLGLVYGVEVRGSSVLVYLTFTAMGCPASDLILADIQERLGREPGVDQVAIEVVWDPPWTAARLTPAGRETLVAWGLAV
jgi:metal-sulfur cluster biosynthetic enzyme